MFAKMDAKPSEAREIAKAIVAFYRRNPVRMAELADTEIDRSGALLGYIRDCA